jgi:hypothetical protein
VGSAKLECFSPFRNRHSADAPEGGHVKVHSRRSQVIQGKRSFSETCIRMLRRPGKDVVQLMSNNSGESTANHRWIIPIPEHSHEMRAVYIEKREDPIRRDRDLGKNHARPQARSYAQIGFASCAGSFDGSNSNEIEVFAAFAVTEIFPDDINTSRIEQPFQLGPHHLARVRAHALRMLEVQGQGSCLSVSANTERTHEQYGENRPH